MASFAWRLVPTKKDQAAGTGDLGQVTVGTQETPDGLTQVDDVDQVSLAVDVRPHLGVPPAGPVAEVDTSLDQVFHLDNGHALPSCSPPKMGCYGSRKLVSRKAQGRASPAGVKKVIVSPDLDRVKGILKKNGTYRE
jgi:hypothetical protein